MDKTPLNEVQLACMIPVLLNNTPLAQAGNDNYVYQSLVDAELHAIADGRAVRTNHPWGEYQGARAALRYKHGDLDTCEHLPARVTVIALWEPDKAYCETCMEQAPPIDYESDHTCDKCGKFDVTMARGQFVIGIPSNCVTVVYGLCSECLRG